MKTLNPKHQTFILEMIRHGNKILAYQTAYPNAKGEACRKAAERLLSDPLIADPINEAVERIRKQALWEAAQERKQQEKANILSIEKKREVLAKLILGETLTRRHVKLKDDYIAVYDSPKPYEIIRAIETDSKLACNYWKENDKEDDGTVEGFEIFIDGQPFNRDEPVNPNIPRGLVIIPRTGDYKAYLDQQARLHKEAENSGSENPEHLGTTEQDGINTVPLREGESAEGRQGEDSTTTPANPYQSDYPEVPDYQNLPGVGTFAVDVRKYPWLK